MKPLKLNMDRYHKVADNGVTSKLRQHDTGHTIEIAHKALPREQRAYLRALPLYTEDKADPEQAHAQGLKDGGRVERGIKGDAIELAGDKERVADSRYVQSNPDYKREMAQAFRKKMARGGDDKLAGALRKHYDEGDIVTGNSSSEPSLDQTLQNLPPPPQEYSNFFNKEQNDYSSGKKSEHQMATPVSDQAQSDYDEYNNLKNTDSGKRSNEDDARLAELEKIAHPSSSPPPPPPPNRKTAQAVEGAEYTGPQTGEPQQAGAVVAPQENKAAPDALNATSSPLSPNLDTTASPQGGLTQQIQGAELGANTATTLARANQPFIEQRAEGEKASADYTQKFLENQIGEINQLEKERADPANNTVGDEHYWQNHSKIASALGMIIAGFNPTNRPNAAIEYLNNAIARDTQDQRAKIGQKNDLLSHYVSQFPNINHAMEFVNSAKKNAIASQMEAKANKLTDQFARQQLLDKAGKLRYDAGISLLPYTAAQGVTKSLQEGNDNSGLIPQLEMSPITKPLAEHIKGVTLVGQGNFHLPPPQNVMDEMAFKTKTIEASEFLRNFIKQHSTVPGIVDPLYRDQANTYAGEIYGMYRQAQNSPANQEEGKKIAEILPSDPKKFLDVILGNRQYQALETSFKNNIDSYKNYYGFTPNPKVAAQKQAVPAQQQSSQYVPGHTYYDKDGTAHKAIEKGGKIFLRKQ